MIVSCDLLASPYTWYAIVQSSAEHKTMLSKFTEWFSVYARHKASRLEAVAV